MHHRFTFLVGLSLALVLVSGCAKSYPHPQRPDEPCQGQAVLKVGNASGLEIVIVEAYQGARHVIATVGPGQHVLPIRRDRDASYYARSADGRWGGRPSFPGRTFDPERHITLTRECLQT